MTAHAPFNLVTGPQDPSKKLRLHFLDLGGLKSAFAFSPSPSAVPDSQSKSASVRTASCGVQRPAADQAARLMAREHPPNVRTAPCTFANILLFGRFFLVFTSSEYLCWKVSSLFFFWEEEGPLPSHTLDDCLDKGNSFASTSWLKKETVVLVCVCVCLYSRVGTVSLRNLSSTSPHYLCRQVNWRSF
jgi:hypothetical protein